MKVAIELPYETIEELVVAELVDMYDILTDNGDMEATKMLKHLRKVIGFYSSPDQWREFKAKFPE